MVCVIQYTDVVIIKAKNCFLTAYSFKLPPRIVFYFTCLRRLDAGSHAMLSRCKLLTKTVRMNMLLFWRCKQCKEFVHAYEGICFPSKLC